MLQDIKQVYWRANKEMEDSVRRISAPLSDEVIDSLRAGDNVLISGKVFAARDESHKRLARLIQEGEELPIHLQGAIIYYVGPSPARPGRIVGSAGPTTSGRMDLYTPDLLARGLKGMIGKGTRSEEVIEAIKREGAVYFGTIGGAGALLSRCIKSISIVAYQDLGPEALMEMEIVDLPAVVVVDRFGNDLYKMWRKQVL
jgi:fumarate hydratase subunit beta